MKHLQEVLQRHSLIDCRPRYSLTWSAGKREELARIARNEIKPIVPIDVPLATHLLKCADGGFTEAEPQIIDLLRQNIDRCLPDNETFISLLNAVFVLQRFDIVAAMLRDKYGFTGEFGIDATDTGLGIGQIQWDISPSREHRFIFDAECFGHDNTRLEIMAFQWEFPLFANYSCVREQESGSVVVGRRDIGRTPGLAYCDSRPEFFLIPDCVFVPSKGYSAARSFFADNRVAWQDRRSTAFWRGATTGMPSRHGDWASLPRIKLCEISRQHENTGLLDAGISAIVQFTSQSVAEEITKSGLMRGFVPWQKWNQYKYLIDIDGNSSPWSNLFQRLLTASTVLKVESISGYRQWYYDKLMPWRNYVPVAPDMWDLIDKIKWLRLHDSAARMIGQRGFELAEELSYERELSRSVPVVSSAFRYFSGRYDNPSPCGTQVEPSN